MPYRGQMQTALLTDQGIRAKEFNKWRQVHASFQRGKRRDIVERYKQEIRQRGGLKKPIWLDVDDEVGHVYVGDGHHRAVALIELGIRDFPFHWRLCSKAGWFSQPPLERGTFPYRLLDL